MFTPGDRDRVRAELISAARSDEAIAGAALTGSAAVDGEDRWSDIDLALGLAEGADSALVIARWTERMYVDHDAIHHLDIVSGATVCRVFMLASTLQVDISFAPAAEFGAVAPAFRLLFGTGVSREPRPEPGAAALAGQGWLCALQARSSLQRGRAWQAEYMISGIRDHALALACLRHGLPTAQGRGMDRLPPEVLAPGSDAFARSPEPGELARAFRAATEALLAEVGQADGQLAARLAATLRELARTDDREVRL